MAEIPGMNNNIAESSAKSQRNNYKETSSSMFLSKETGKREVTAETKEGILIEKMAHKIANAAARLQIEVEGNKKLSSKSQKERGAISVEKDGNRIFVKSFGEKTEIKAEKLHKNEDHLGLKIEGKDGVVYSLGYGAASKVGDEVIVYQGYDDEDILILTGMANILNSAMYFAKHSDNKQENPFNSHGTLSRGHILTVRRYEGLVFQKDIISQSSLMTFIKRHSKGNIENQVKINTISANLIDNMEKYLNRRYFDEMIKKETASK